MAVAQKKVVILFSGGADSRLLMERAKRLGYVVYALIFRYGQRMEEEEVGAAVAYCSSPFSPQILVHRQCSLRAAFVDVKSRLLTTEVDYPGVHSMYVPARNLVFLSVAVSWAESMGASEVWYGANYTSKLNGFPDCTQDFVYKMNELLRVSLSRPVQVCAPLLGLTKEQVWEELDSLGVDRETIFSGYGQ